MSKQLELPLQCTMPDCGNPRLCDHCLESQGEDYILYLKRQLAFGYAKAVLGYKPRD